MSIAAVATPTIERSSHTAEERTCLRTASASDASAIHALIMEHLAEGRLLPRDRDEIAFRAHRFLLAVRDDRIVACAELAPLSRDIAEVRSLVVHRDARSLGLGSDLVAELIDRATTDGFKKLCAFTHTPSFFVRHGFSIVPHVWLPEKIMTDCHACPQFRRCGQYAVLQELGRARRNNLTRVSVHG
ncbi:MAG: GNAT family N-acetyltransferase [Acidobacteria bacterium]|nr:GNAT family N-acetyltransferase [Acidobacteriota bacterium]